MKFDFIIGNPPYQDETLGDNKGFAPPIYDKFMDATFDISEKVELIHPARFLFNAGSTPKAWNQKMLNSEHYKILFYESDSSLLFANTDIKGGVVISYYDAEQTFSPIHIFTKYEELNQILKKVGSITKDSISDISITSYAYHFTPLMHEDFPNARSLMSKGHDFDLKSNIFERLPMVFIDEDPHDGFDYIRIIGRSGNERITKFIRRDYINNVKNLDKIKILLPKASGIGSFGEALGSFIIADAGVGHTETFFSIGSFDEESQAIACSKYIKTKFSRSLLSVLKTTQNMTPSNWSHVPLQDFTPNSDIDWSQSVADIDQQLYRKYGLDDTEIAFIESHVKEMA